MTKLSPKQVIKYWQTILNNRIATDGELQEANLMASFHSTNPVVMHCTDFRECNTYLSTAARRFSREVNLLYTGPKHRRHVFRYEAKEILQEIIAYKN